MSTMCLCSPRCSDPVKHREKIEKTQSPQEGVKTFGRFLLEIDKDYFDMDVELSTGDMAAIREMLNAHAQLIHDLQSTVKELRERVDKLETDECCHLKCFMCGKSDCTVSLYPTTSGENSEPYEPICESCHERNLDDLPFIPSPK